MLQGKWNTRLFVCVSLNKTLNLFFEYLRGLYRWLRFVVLVVATLQRESTLPLQPIAFFVQNKTQPTLNQRLHELAWCFVVLRGKALHDVASDRITNYSTCAARVTRRNRSTRPSFESWAYELGPSSPPSGESTDADSLPSVTRVCRRWRNCMRWRTQPRKPVCCSSRS